MPSFNFNVANKVPPDEIFADMPSGLKSYLNRGFAQIAELEQSKVSMLASVLSEGHQSTEEAGVNEILRRLEVDCKDKGSFGTALGILTLIVTGRDDVDAVIAAGEHAGVIPPLGVERVTEVASELARGKSTLTNAIEATHLANAIAPTFDELSIAVELRFGFDDAKVARFVPIALCRLDTDKDDVGCLFQMRKSDITRLILQLKKVEAQVSAMEEWSKGRK
jgi:hypothetical protein